MPVTEFGNAFMFILFGMLFVLGGALTSRLLAPRRPSAEKLSTYECGEEPLGSAWGRYNFRFYVMALIFLVFDVELILLFPWVTVFADPALIRAAPAWGLFSLVEVGAFLGILVLGLAYVWVKGDIDWVRPNPQRPSTPTGVPAEAYRELNARLRRNH